MSSQQQWWKTGTIYQVYPKSFYDTNNDGIGDLRGIIKKLPYFKKLGIDALWLTPVFPSPQHDNGYDIKDYRAIDPQYGSLDDFKELITKAHDQGLKIIIDIVVNHTSTEHPWFIEARKSKESPRRDYYIWRDRDHDKEPNNWQSKFGGSAWQYNEATGDYYLHLFDKSQADLNWENPRVMDEVVGIMSFWAELGIDGFRLDVINLLSKNQDFPDDEHGDGRMFYTDGPKIHQYLKQLNQQIFTPKNLFTVGEMSSTTIEHCVRYSNPQENELNMVFNFHHLKIDYKNGDKWSPQKPDFQLLKTLFSTWQTAMQQYNGWNALFWSNHDQPRVVSRYGMDTTEPHRLLSAKMLAVILYAMRGTTYIFQGEEIGLPNPMWNHINEFNDIESLNYYQILKEKGLSDEEALHILSLRSRDNSRVPLPWDDSAHGGFTQGEPWLKVFPRYEEINIEKALKDPSSVFYFYQKLIALRKEEKELIVNGQFRLFDTVRDIIIYERRAEHEKLLSVANLKNTTINVPLSAESCPIDKAKVLISNYDNQYSHKGSLILRPFEAMILKWRCGKPKN